MPRRCLLGGLICGLLWGLSLPAPAVAGDLLGWLRGNHLSYTAEYLGAGAPGVTAAPGPRLYPGCNLFRPQYVVPIMPSFHWGYFGAPYRADHFCHQGYHGDCASWRYRRH
jgi:hypothetical protein